MKYSNYNMWETKDKQSAEEDHVIWLKAAEELLKMDHGEIVFWTARTNFESQIWSQNGKKKSLKFSEKCKLLQFHKNLLSKLRLPRKTTESSATATQRTSCWPPSCDVMLFIVTWSEKFRSNWKPEKHEFKILKSRNFRKFKTFNFR